ncbi:MAG: hypothetical protein QOG49_1116, partial [Frankiaceae bacterium]|nr:hypothetical protein [Frankiaceae bacterium]
ATALGQQKLVVELGEAALSGQPLQRVLDDAVGAVAALLGITTVAVLEIDERDGQVTLTPVARVPVTLEPVQYSVELFATMTPGRAVSTGVPAVLEDVAQLGAVRAAEIIEMYGVRSAGAVPMVDPSTFHGVLQAADALPRRFGDDEIAFLQQVANVLSAAIAHTRTQERLVHQAMHDPLTGLPNRTMFRAALDDSIAAARASGGATGLLLLDLDGFKDVNDSLGHAAGDQVLEQLAIRLAAAAGDGSLVARLGGDEFAVCIKDLATPADLHAEAERLTAALHAPFELDGLSVPLSASIGIVSAPAHGADASTLLRRADVAMYRAKAERSGWATYEDNIDHARAMRLTSIAELRVGIRAGDLEVYYQPIVDLAKSEVTEVEALVRWRHPVRGLVAPDEFIALAEHSGLIGELTTSVIEQAVADLQVWQRDGRELRCAVNLSVAALAHASVADELVRQVIAGRDLISVEITESALADSRARRTLHDLADAGVSCAIDDFGTGYSSLAALRSLPVDTLKIDRAFVLDVDRSTQAFAIIKSVVQVADALGLRVIAEGVETAEIETRIYDAGVRRAQGYFYARPMPAAELGPWLDENARTRSAGR